MNVEKLFNSFNSVEKVSDKSIDILNALMSLKNPLKFDDNIATDQELDTLERELDMLNVQSNELQQMLNTIISLPPLKSNKFLFI